MRKYIDLMEAYTSYSEPELGSEPGVYEGAPELGVKIAHKGKAYAVVGWMTEVRQPGVFGKRGGQLVSCNREKATWVVCIGGGGAGTVCPVRDVKIVGSMRWSPEQHQKVVQQAMAAAANKHTLPKPPTA